MYVTGEAAASSDASTPPTYMAIGFSDPRATLIGSTTTASNTSGMYNPYTDTYSGATRQQMEEMYYQHVRAQQQAEAMRSIQPLKPVEPDYLRNEKLLLLGEAS